MTRILPFLILGLLASCAKHSSTSHEGRFDVLILNGSVYRDGESVAEDVDLGIVGDRIVAMGDLDSRRAKRVVDATGKLVVPGFIDVHSHADKGGALEEYLAQGVTTIVAGNCGRSLDVVHPESAYESLKGELGPNYIGLIGHNSLRSSVGLEGSEPTDEQLLGMNNYLKKGMDAGAFGMSTGLIYNSGFNSTTEEIVALANVVAEYDGVYATHMRNEGETVMESVYEALTVGHRSGTRVQISHAKCAGPAAWGLSDDFMALVDRAVDDGQEVWVDQYPYSASQTTINAVIPDWAENDWENVLENRRGDLEKEIAELIAGRGGADRVYMVRGPFPKRTLGDVSTELGKAPEIVVIDDVGLSGASAIYHMMQEDDVRTFMAHPRVMTGSDGPSSTHPRGHGSFPRVWGNYGREESLLSHQDCVQKTSTLAATQFRLIDQKRGKLEEGFFADVVILDPETIIDHATFDSPKDYPTGITDVLVNGQLIVRGGVNTGKLAGRVLRYGDSIRPK